MQPIDFKCTNIKRAMHSNLHVIMNQKISLFHFPRYKDTTRGSKLPFIEITQDNTQNYSRNVRLQESL